MDDSTAVQEAERGEVAGNLAAAKDGNSAEGNGERDTVCLDRQDLRDLLRRVRGLEQLIGRALGGVVD